MTSLSIVSAQGYMPISRAIPDAYAKAAALTMQLAATAAPLPSAVLALTEPMSGLPKSTAGMLPGSSADPLLDQLTRAANNACYTLRDPHACASASQTLAAYQAGASCTNTAAIAALRAKQDRGSIQDWFRPPMQVMTIKPTTDEIAAAAISLAAVRAFQ